MKHTPYKQWAISEATRKILLLCGLFWLTFMGGSLVYLSNGQDNIILGLFVVSMVVCLCGFYVLYKEKSSVSNASV